MTTPDIDPRDYVYNPHMARIEEAPKYVWSVYYKGNTGNWIWSFPHFHEENATKLAEIYGPRRETRILKYKLIDDIEFTGKKEKKVKKQKKVKQVK